MVQEGLLGAEEVRCSRWCGGNLRSRLSECLLTEVPYDRLPGAFPEMLRDGQLYTALVISTLFSEKYRGRDMKRGDFADVRLVGTQNEVWRLSLLGRTGQIEAVPFIWLGDERFGDKTLYVAFSPLRRKRQFVKLYSKGTVFVDDAAPGRETIRMAAYMKSKLDELWSPSFGFRELLGEAAAVYPQHRILFTGISHGAALAQAAALRFSLTAGADANRVFAASWNAYKWTDAAGSDLVHRELGSRLLPMVLSRAGPPRRWDPAAEFPRGFAPMPHILLLDVDTGSFLEKVRLGDARLGKQFATRMAELHFAKTAMLAMRAAMDVAGRGPTPNSLGRRSWSLVRHAASGQRLPKPSLHEDPIKCLFDGLAKESGDDEGSEDDSGEEDGGCKQ